MSNLNGRFNYSLLPSHITLQLIPLPAEANVSIVLVFPVPIAGDSLISVCIDDDDDDRVVIVVHFFCRCAL